jgi:glycerol-3-phosphate acyltransferase PlsY
MIKRPKAGHEPKTPPQGRLAVVLLFALLPISAIILGGAWLVRNATAPIEVRAGVWTLREVDRVSTGLQRADRIHFSADGASLAVNCPRYQKVVIYGVDPVGKLVRPLTVPLDGRPVALAVAGNRFVVLQRPPGDRCHLEPGWFEVLDREGNRIGSKIPAGDYPDDLAFSPDRRTLYVLSSGRGEGGPRKPLPRLTAFRPDPNLTAFVPVGHVEFKASDDPARLQISRAGTLAVVSRINSQTASAFDLSDPGHPRMIEESPLPNPEAPTLSLSPENGDAIILPARNESEGVAIDLLSPNKDGSSPPFLARTSPEDSTIEINQPMARTAIATFPLRGKLNLGRAHPSGIAYSRNGRLIAVSTRTGAIHLIAIESRTDERTPTAAVAGAVGTKSVTR